MRLEIVSKSLIDKHKDLSYPTLPRPMNDNTTPIKVRELREEINNMKKKLEELEKSFE